MCHVLRACEQRGPSKANIVLQVDRVTGIPKIPAQDEVDRTRSTFGQTHFIGCLTPARRTVGMIKRELRGIKILRYLFTGLQIAKDVLKFDIV